MKYPDPIVPAIAKPDYENCLRQVSEQVRVVLVALQIIPAHQVLDPFLDELEISLEHPAKLLHDFHSQLLVLQYLSGFHGSDNGSIHSIASVLVQVFNDLLSLINGRQRHLHANHSKL